MTLDPCSTTWQQDQDTALAETCLQLGGASLDELEELHELRPAALRELELLRQLRAVTQHLAWQTHDPAETSGNSALVRASVDVDVEDSIQVKNDS